MPNSSGFQVNEILTAANTNTYLLRPYQNAIINAGMNIVQRSATVAGITTSGYYTADRWFNEILSAGTWTHTVQSLGSSETPLQDGARNSLKVTCTTANSSLASGAYNTIQQRFEGNRLQQFAKGTSGAKSFALSFWVKSNRTGTYIAELYDFTNTRTVSASYTITDSGVWQKVRIVYPMDYLGLLNNDNNISLMLCFWLAAGSGFSGGTLNTVWNNAVTPNRAAGQVNLAASVNNYWEMTAVQLEPNNVCTPFEVVPAADDFISCRRYFQRHIQPSLRGVSNGSFTRMALHYGTPMRALPTATSNGGTMGFWDGASSPVGNVGFVGVFSFSNTTIEFDLSSAGWTIGRAACLYQISTNTFFMDLNAEL